MICVGIYHGHDSKRLNGPEKKNICTACGQKLLDWKLMGSTFHLVEIFVTVPKQNLTDFLRYQPQIWNTTCLDVCI